MADGNKVTIFNLTQEESLQKGDFVPVSDGDSTRRLNLYNTVLAVDLSNITDLSSLGTTKLVDTFIDYLHLEDEDTGLLLSKGEEYSLKTSLYTINKKLPDNIIVPDADIDYTRDIKIDDEDIPVNLLGKELTRSGNSIANLTAFRNIENINDFDQRDSIKLYDYVKVLNDPSKPSSPSYYVLVGYNSSTGELDRVTPPTAADTTSWKYVGFSDSYSKLKLHELLVDIASNSTRSDLLNILIANRKEINTSTGKYTGAVFTTLHEWVNSKTPLLSYQGLYNLKTTGTTSQKGNYPETIRTYSSAYNYDPAKDFGDSRFARKSLNNLKVNGTEQLYDPTTDWGDNRFAHKALDNLKSANSTDTEAESYDSTKDYGNSRFARKNLNNLRSDTYDILNDKIPSYIKSGSTSINFLTNDNFAIVHNAENVSLTFNKYVLDTISKSATSLKTDYTYTLNNVALSFNHAIPSTAAGVVSSLQAQKIFDALISVNGFTSERTWAEYNTFVSSLSQSEREYYNKAWYKKIITDDEVKGQVPTKSGLPLSQAKVGDKWFVTGDSAYYYWDGTDWFKEGTRQVYTKDEQISDGNIVLTGYNIPVTAADWNDVKKEPIRGKSLGERIEHLENLGVFLGTVDVKSGEYYIVDINNDSSITVMEAGSGYEVNDVISINTDVPGQTMYLKITDYASEYTLAGTAGVPVVIFPKFGLSGLTNGSLFYTPHPLAQSDNVIYKGMVNIVSQLPESADSRYYYWVRSENTYYHYVTSEWVRIEESDNIFAHKVHGGSGNGMTINVIASANDGQAATTLPTNISQIPGATLKDYMNVRFDTDHCGVPCRYYIKSIDNNGIITWELDILLENVERNFVNEPISHNELNVNAIHNDNILDGTIGTEKLAFSITSVSELYSQNNEQDVSGKYILGNIDFNLLTGNSTYIIRGSSCSNSPVYNTNLNLSADVLEKMGIDVSSYPDITDTSKWKVEQYFVRNVYNSIIAGYQTATNLYYPGMVFSRCIIPPTNTESLASGRFPTITSDDYRNWTLIHN